MAKIVKARHWAFVVYPDSRDLSPDWVDQLALTGLQCAISPLHDKDINPNAETDEEKKAHWHLIASWAGPTTEAQAEALGKRFGFVRMKKPLNSVRGYYRYFTHMDNPDKYQYDEREIQRIGGFDINDHIEMTLNERLKILAQVEDFIDDNDIREYSRLSKALRHAGMLDWWRVVATSTIHVNTYITSRRHEMEAIEGTENPPPAKGGG